MLALLPSKGVGQDTSHRAELLLLLRSVHVVLRLGLLLAVGVPSSSDSWKHVQLDHVGRRLWIRDVLSGDRAVDSEASIWALMTRWKFPEEAERGQIVEGYDQAYV